MRITAITASNDSEKAVLDYLEANASDELVKKINNGVVIEKDGKRPPFTAGRYTTSRRTASTVPSKTRTGLHTSPKRPRNRRRS